MAVMALGCSHVRNSKALQALIIQAGALATVVSMAARTNE